MRELTRAEIEAILPHRLEAQMLDRAKVEEGWAQGYHFVTEKDCRGHLPGRPIYAGHKRDELIQLTLGVAALAQLPPGKIPVVVLKTKVTYPNKATVGDEIRAEVRVLRQTASRVVGTGKAFVNDTVVCEIERIIGLLIDSSEVNKGG